MRCWRGLVPSSYFDEAMAVLVAIEAKALRREACSWLGHLQLSAQRPTWCFLVACGSCWGSLDQGFGGRHLLQSSAESRCSMQ